MRIIILMYNKQSCPTCGTYLTSVSLCEVCYEQISWICTSHKFTKIQQFTSSFEKYMHIYLFIDLYLSTYLSIDSSFCYLSIYLTLISINCWFPPSVGTSGCLPAGNRGHARAAAAWGARGRRECRAVAVCWWCAGGWGGRAPHSSGWCG